MVQRHSLLTSLRAHRGVGSIITRSTSLIVSVYEHTRRRKAVVDRKMVRLVRTIPAKIILEREVRQRRIVLIEDALLRIRIGNQIQIVEEGRHSVIRDMRIRQRHGLVLRRATENGNVAVGAGIGGRVLLGVDLHCRGQGNVTVRVIFI